MIRGLLCRSGAGGGGARLVEGLCGNMLGGAEGLAARKHLLCEVGLGRGRVSLVPGGGLSFDGRRWVACRPGFFLPVRVLSRLFRRLFLQYLQAAYEADTLRLEGSLEALRDRPTWTRTLGTLRHTEWIVYAKRPFAGPRQVLDYVGRYTHRVAISNNRLLDIENGTVRLATSAAPRKITLRCRLFPPTAYS